MTTTSASTLPAKATAPETLYFAYGSNLQLAQMARRCPSSRYIGIGHLRDYKFQINNRCYANVIPASPEDVVTGLCYLLTKEDEDRLDVCEGVAVRTYEKESLEIGVSLAHAEIVGRKAAEIVELGLVKGSGDAGRQGGLERASEGEVLQALVYVSRHYTAEGSPLEEYIERVNLGIADAVRLGVSEKYVEKYVRKYIPFR